MSGTCGLDLAHKDSQRKQSTLQTVGVATLDLTGHILVTMEHASERSVRGPL
jgi:hypothetical protein